MEKTVIQATPRTVIGKQVRALRRDGLLPAVIYGPRMEPIMISMDAHSSSRILAHITASSLVTIELEGKEYPSLVREKQRNFITNNLLHVDFQVVSMTETLRTKVGIHLIGEAPVIEAFEAIIINGLEELEVECLPQDLPERIVVDISNLVNVGDAIYVRDIQVSGKVEILDDKDEMIVLATSTYEEPKEEVEISDGDGEPEVIERGKKDEDEEENKED
jgi:large subunit ribosomal protein L25